LGKLPEGEVSSPICQLRSCHESDDLISIDSSESDFNYRTEKLKPPILVSNGLPPIPVRRVEEGLFIEMAELSPSYLGSAEFNTGHRSKLQKQPPEVVDIVEWVQCFGTYVAIVSCSKPKRVADLIG